MKFILYIFVSFCFIFPQVIYANFITDSLIQRAEKKYTTQSKNRFLALRDTLIKNLQDESDLKKINKVNTWINFIKYKSDKEVYGVSDYWATMYEFVGKGMGDCEDYTIAKYYILKELGISPKRLKFTYVIYKDRLGKNISHMVLSYLKIPKPKTTKDILILDNNNRLVLPASQRKDLIKVVKMMNGDTGAKSKKWKKLEAGMKNQKL